MAESPKHKIAVLEDEGPPEAPPPEAPPSFFDGIKRMLVPTLVVGTLFGLILSVGVCIGYVFVWRSPPPDPPGGTVAVLPFLYQGAEDTISGPFMAALQAGLVAEPLIQPTAQELLGSYAEDPRGLGEIGAELGVRYVVQGELRPQGEQLAATFTLVNVEKGGAVFTNERVTLPLTAAADLDELVLARIKEGTNVTPPPGE
ncbi:MAG: hypothetical protein JXX28_01920 [Deltaproteobacteria bacterium]|nr:hypothetical protein [Deltaproteobacteria bacterium]